MHGRPYGLFHIVQGQGHAQCLGEKKPPPSPATYARVTLCWILACRIACVVHRRGSTSMRKQKPGIPPEATETRVAARSEKCRQRPIRIRLRCVGGNRPFLAWILT